jgi:hypothetical protein
VDNEDSVESGHGLYAPRLEVRLMWTRPNLPIGTILLIGGELNVHDLGFEPRLIQTSTTVTPMLRWLSTTHNAIDLAEKAFLQANREHKKERDERNLKSQVNMKLMILKRSSSLYSKELIATGEQDQEQGPWFTASNLGDTVAANNVCSTRKSRTQKNPNPNKSDGD